MTETSSITLSPEGFAQAFPFHIAFDRSLHIIQLGMCLQRVLPELAAGALVPEWFRATEGAVSWDIRSLHEYLGRPLVLQCTRRSLTLRGELVWLDSSSVFVFLCTLSVPSAESMRSCGLSPDDFPFHDTTRDVQQIIDSQATALSDVKRLAEELESQRTALREAHDALQAEIRELQRSEALKTSILETAISGIITVDAVGIVESMNPAAERILGYAAHEVIGRNVCMLAPSPHREQHASYLTRYLATREARVIGIGRDVDARRKDGTLVPIHLSVGEARIDGQIHFTGIIMDMTAFREAEVRLRASEERFALAVEGSNDGIWDFHLQEKRVYFSPRFAELLGYDPDEFTAVCNDFHSHIHADDLERVREAERLHQEERKPFDIEFRVRHKDGSDRWLRSRGRAIWDSQGRSIRMAGSVSDITSRKDVETALHHAREKEVETSAAIQSSLLAGRIPRTLRGLHAAIVAVPSQRVDGDFVDFIASDHVLQLTVGDVMGKGIRAALLGAATKNQFLRAAIAELLATHTGVPSPAEVVNAVHQVLTPGFIQLESFVTACVARFDTRIGDMTFVNAGHTRILRKSAATGEVEYIGGSHLPLGVLPDEVYTESRIHFAPGDIFVFHSDGVTEATAPSREMFGQGRLAELVRRFPSGSCKRLIATIHRELLAFVGEGGFTDDLTCVAVRIDDLESPTQTVQCQVDTQGASAAEVRRQYRQFISSGIADGLTSEQIDGLELALHEVFTNAVRHGRGGAARISFNRYSNRVMVSLRKESPKFDPDAVLTPSFGGGQDSGFGLHLVDNAVDVAQHYREGETNVVELLQFFASDNGRCKL